MKLTVEDGSTIAPEKYQIKIDAVGPYLVFGQPRLVQQFIMPNNAGMSWSFKEGLTYSTIKEPTALCRCGSSLHKPYCDGAHLKADWDPTLTASTEPILDEAEEFSGPLVSITDNRKYCAFARFCDAKGQIWNLVGENNEAAAEMTIREANHCPSARLSAWKKGHIIPVEPAFEPNLGLIEDPKINCSGPLWVRGGIPVVRPDGLTYEVRNRVTLCRCGQSSNKPYCDGTHASMGFADGLPNTVEEDNAEF